MVRFCIALLYYAVDIVHWLTGDGVVQFTHGVEEEKAWVSEHLTRAQSSRPLLNVTMQLANITSLSKVIDSHQPLLQHVIEVGRNLLQRCRSLPPHQCLWQRNVEAELTQLDRIWRELETVVRQQKERLMALNAADSERQVSCSSSRLSCLLPYLVSCVILSVICYCQPTFSCERLMSFTKLVIQGTTAVNILLLYILSFCDRGCLSSG